MVTLRSCKFHHHHHPLLSRVLFGSSFSISTQQINQTHHNNVLYDMISPAKLKPTASIAPILDQWVQQGGTYIKPDDLRNIIKALRNHNRYSQALQVYLLLTICFNPFIKPMSRFKLYDSLYWSNTLITVSDTFNWLNPSQDSTFMSLITVFYGFLV